MRSMPCAIWPTDVLTLEPETRNTGEQFLLLNLITDRDASQELNQYLTPEGARELSRRLLALADDVEEANHAV